MSAVESKKTDPFSGASAVSITSSTCCQNSSRLFQRSSAVVGQFEKIATAIVAHSALRDEPERDATLRFGADAVGRQDKHLCQMPLRGWPNKLRSVKNRSRVSDGSVWT